MIIGAGQFAAVPGDIATNVGRMAALLAAAADTGIHLVVFAELAVTHYDLAAIAADPTLLIADHDDARLDRVRNACRELGIAAVINAPAQAVDESGRTISTFVYGPDGGLLTRYDKLHMFEETEAGIFVTGAADGRFELDGLRFALATCHDNSYPDIPARAAADGCQVYLASSFHDLPERIGRYAQLARDNSLFVVLANGLGPGPYGPACGRSGAWLPSGEQVAAAEPGEHDQLVRAEVVLSGSR
ncbi:carbon-nitrogen hydrolase family protein [Nocardia arthritidis]|uniref:carbon-nitrogen hydrolase family protein n=1 Tax=Nocardia arthritidis TaxID=228602 RepID=UPI00142D9693|nr:carbon-nitrogen hydrolase family protein [Nocardia arthritidis]